MSNQLFITVKYGDNKEKLFNPHCKSMLLLECIKEKCKCDENITIDLADENGNVSNISERENIAEYANQFLEGRKKYILIQIKKPPTPDTEPNKYEPLLLNVERLYPDLLESLDRLSRPAQTSPKSKQVVAKKRMGKTKSPKRNSVAKIF